MIKTINFETFADGFTGSYKDNFSYEGKKALFEYLEQWDEETGTQTEFDPIAICCEWTEYASADEAGRENFDYEGMTYGEDGGELKTVDEVEAEAMEYLENRGVVIKLENGGVIINS